MPVRPALAALLGLALALPASAQTASDQAAGGAVLDSLDALATALAAEHGLPSVVVAVTRGGRRQTAAAGAVDGAAPTDRTRYEVGSVTKAVTGLALAEMARRGEVALTTPVARLLPDSVRVPAGGAAPVTLVDLATHTSGLPRLPPTFLGSVDPDDPYAGYGERDLYAFLGAYDLPRAPAAAYEYSNVGAGLLGLALGRRHGGGYEALVRERVLDPLGMTETSVAVPDSVRFAPAVGVFGQPVPHWGWTEATVGMGGLRSTAADLLALVEATIAPPLGLPPSLAAALGDAARPVRRAPGRMRVGLGWHVIPDQRDGPGVVWHNGGTGGGSSFVGLDRASGVGVVVLANRGGAANAAVTEFGFDVLRRLVEATAPPAE